MVQKRRFLWIFTFCKTHRTTHWPWLPAGSCPPSPERAMNLWSWNFSSPTTTWCCFRTSADSDCHRCLWVRRTTNYCWPYAWASTLAEWTSVRRWCRHGMWTYRQMVRSIKQKKNKMQILVFVFDFISTISTLTLSCNKYHCGCGLSNTRPCRFTVTSPRKSFRPNMSECQTVSHSDRDSRLLSDMWKRSVSSNVGLRVCFFTLVLRLPVFDLSGSR